jgi:hypothetical protein
MIKINNEMKFDKWRNETKHNKQNKMIWKVVNVARIRIWVQNFKDLCIDITSWNSHIFIQMNFMNSFSEISIDYLQFIMNHHFDWFQMETQQYHRYEIAK